MNQNLMLLEVTDIRLETSKVNGSKYKVVTFLAKKTWGDRLIATDVVGTRVFWPKHTTTKDGKEFNFRGNGEYANLVKGMLFEGCIKRFQTTPYQIAGSENLLTSYSCVAIGNEDPEQVAARQMERVHGGTAFNAHGEPIVLQQLSQTPKKAISGKDDDKGLPDDIKFEDEVIEEKTGLEDNDEEKKGEGAQPGNEPKKNKEKITK